MKKQYRTDEPDWKTWRIDIYHDGTKITSETFLRIQDDEYNDRLDELEAQGYTYGYTVEEVENAKKLYEHKLNNVIDCNYCIDLAKIEILEEFVEALKEKSKYAKQIPAGEYFEAVDVEDINNLVKEKKGEE